MSEIDWDAFEEEAKMNKEEYGISLYFSPSSYPTSSSTRKDSSSVVLNDSSDEINKRYFRLRFLNLKQYIRRLSQLKVDRSGEQKTWGARDRFIRKIEFIDNTLRRAFGYKVIVDPSHDTIRAYNTLDEYTRKVFGYKMGYNKMGSKPYLSKWEVEELLNRQELDKKTCQEIWSRTSTPKKGEGFHE